MNTIKIYNTKKYYFISVITHGMLFLIALLGLDFSEQTPVLGNETTQMVNSYVLQDAARQVVNVTRNIKSQIETKPAASQKEAVIKTKKIVKSRADKTPATTVDATNQSQQNQPSAASTSSRGQQTEALLGMLHTAIQKQQHYPDSAMQMERQGRATVKFTLFTNGSINQLRIAHTSGTESLDQAALAAVRDAVPFNGVEKYITEAAEFSIDVVFELS